MKKTTFKIRHRVDGVEVLQEVIAEEYDEFVYYVSPRTNKDFKYKYSFYDKKTGLMLCYGKNKQELLDKWTTDYKNNDGSNDLQQDTENNAINTLVIFVKKVNA